MPPSTPPSYSNSLHRQVDADAQEKILAVQTKFKMEKLELEEKLAFAESEMNHKLKTCILETEQRIHEREAEAQRQLKTQARDAESANENYKHELANLMSELQVSKRESRKGGDVVCGRSERRKRTERWQIILHVLLR